MLGSRGWRGGWWWHGGWAAAPGANHAVCLLCCLGFVNASLTVCCLPFIPIQVEASSYENIALSLGVDSPTQVLFATDNPAEAEAAAAAGWAAVLVDRPGNKPLLAEGLRFPVVKSMQEALAQYRG